LPADSGDKSECGNSDKFFASSGYHRELIETDDRVDCRDNGDLDREEGSTVALTIR
jgi:hypothetical protein